MKNVSVLYYLSLLQISKMIMEKMYLLSLKKIIWEPFSNLETYYDLFFLFR